MARDIIRSDELWTPIWPYSYGTRVTGGTILFMAGAISVDKDGNTVGKGDMKAQITQVLENIKTALKAGGATLEDIVNMRIYTTDVDQIMSLAEWRCQNFPELWGGKPTAQEAPSSTLVGVTKLGYDGGMVEIEVVAHLK
jgi:enamine deaminase RidA (YjgF/YER057c/UK114 family)